ncbi:MerR family transcriptional regulator [Clostridium intestinale]|uniref:MerR family transcriptional regulator n=2 Tax=Clostridium intestinale TaxID=36845 RepID=A0A7D6VRY5_9CLOT|nr:MerR family transcriptional regulator [Clostridium intestinale]ERK30042.1 putative transcriptional regulator [Clostridium intestinale URNW]QLY81667.1 MerR family transcriptional regulator [Clostridium intestinale]
MYKIGEFSKITNMTVKTLRYYDEENILTPSYRDKDTNYRYYSEEDFKKAELILMLRNLDFSISEIKDLLNSYEDKSDLSYYLQEKKDLIEKKIQQEKLLLKKIDLYINLDKEEEISMSYEIKIKEIEPVKVASIRFKGKYSDVGKHIGKIYKAIKGKAVGEPFNCYYDSEYAEEADIELCVPTSEKIENDEVTTKELPKIKAITTIHKGDYGSLNKAYKSILDYAKDKNYKCLTPSREIYIKGPGKIFKGNPNNYITEIIIPIELGGTE